MLYAPTARRESRRVGAGDEAFASISLLGIAAACLVMLPCAPAAQPRCRKPVAPCPAPQTLLRRWRNIIATWNNTWKRAQAIRLRPALYWRSIAEKRHGALPGAPAVDRSGLDDYVLTQPPVYSGPPRPRDRPSRTNAVAHRPMCRVVADFLAAAEQRVQVSAAAAAQRIEFKRAYAAAALAAGLTPDQAVRIYSFEATGNGSYDVEAGLEYNKAARAITTALGYNQLLATNTVELLPRTAIRSSRPEGECGANTIWRAARAGGQARDPSPHGRFLQKRAGRLGPRMRNSPGPKGVSASTP